jgi:uncharacterized repeat protein (TIGR01451 family)
VTVLFDETMLPGETWYGAVGLSIDSGVQPFGIFAFDVERLQGMVQKQGPEGVMVGETGIYTITVDANTLYDFPLSYFITDTLPAGMTLVPGSATANMGTVVEVGSDTILWQGTMEVPQKEYIISDNVSDPGCETPFTGGGYQDAETADGITTTPGIEGDTVKWSVGVGTTPFYGETVDTVYITDDGFTLFGNDDIGTRPWVNQDIPDIETPNGLAAQYWRDMELIYSPPPTNAGVSLVNYGSIWMFEFDNAQLFGDPDSTLDYEIITLYDADPSPGSYDMFFAFDNVNIDDNVGTVGIEDQVGTDASQYAHNDFTPTDGLVICLDWVYAGDPAIITYEAAVAGDVHEDYLINTVAHSTDMVGTQPELISYATEIYTAIAKWTTSIRVGGKLRDYTASPITLYENQYPKVIDKISVTSTESVSFTIRSDESGMLNRYSYEVSAGSVSEEGDQLVWILPESTGIAGTEYVLTTTYTVDNIADLSGSVYQTLDLQKGVPENDHIIDFNVVRVDKVAKSMVSPDTTMQYKLLMTNADLVDAFAISDTMPAGVIYGGNLDETGGLAVYDASEDKVIWTSTDNVVGDHSFEQTLSGTPWVSGGDFVGPVCSPVICLGVDEAVTGDFYLWFGGMGITNMSYISQTLTIPEVDEAVLSFWISVAANPAIDQIKLEITIDGELIAVYTEEDALLYGAYTEIHLDVSDFADGDSHVLMLQGTEIGATSASIFVDDVRIVPGKPITTNVIEATWDVDIVGAIGDVIHNVAEVAVGLKSYTVSAETDILSIIWLPRVTRGYPYQP